MTSVARIVLLWDKGASASDDKVSSLREFLDALQLWVSVRPSEFVARRVEVESTSALVARCREAERETNAPLEVEEFVRSLPAGLGGEALANVARELRGRGLSPVFASSGLSFGRHEGEHLVRQAYFLAIAHKPSCEADPASADSFLRRFRSTEWWNQFGYGDLKISELPLFHWPENDVRTRQTATAVLFVLERVLKHGWLLLAEERVELQGSAHPLVVDDEQAYDSWAAERDGVPVSFRALVDESAGEDSMISINMGEVACLAEQLDDAFPALIWAVERVLEGEPDSSRRVRSWLRAVLGRK